MTSIDGSSNVLIPEARAKISMRIVPGSEPETELDALVRHLESHVPWGAKIEVERTKEAPGFRCETDGPGYAAARKALEEAYGKPVARRRLRRVHPAASYPPGRRTARGVHPVGSRRRGGGPDPRLRRERGPVGDREDGDRPGAAHPATSPSAGEAAARRQGRSMSDTSVVAGARGVLAVTCLSTLVVNANTSAVSILLPAISDDTGMSVNDVAVGRHGLLADGRRHHRDVRLAGRRVRQEADLPARPAALHRVLRADRAVQLAVAW